MKETTRGGECTRGEKKREKKLWEGGRDEWETKIRKSR